MRDVFVCGGVVVRVDGWRRASHTVSRVHLQALAGLGDVAHDLRHAALERQLAAVLIQRSEELCQHTNRPTSITGGTLACQHGEYSLHTGRSCPASDSKQQRFCDTVARLYKL